MKRTLLLVTLLVALPLLAQSDPATARYRVELELYPGDDPAVVARQLAATYRAELDSSEPGPTPVLVMSETAAALLRDNPHVLGVTRLDQSPIRTPESHSGATWSTGTYAYDGAGNIKKIGTAETFVYDAFGRLTSGTTRNSGSQAYTYDAYGNLLTITTNDDTAHPVRLGVDPATNRITNGSNPNNAFAWYDGAGNVTGTSAGETYVWDGLGMLKESTVAGRRTLYLYTPDDERIASVRVATNDAVLSTDWTLRDTGGKVLRRYLELPDEQWSWVQDYIYRDGQLIATERAATPRRFHFFPDHLGTPRLITGTGGAEVSRHDYYPFGQEETAWTDGERMKFTGHERDHATLDYMHARSYMTVWGRFLSVDPVGITARRSQSWNRYSYVTNGPLTRTDSTGMYEEEITVTARDPGFSGEFARWWNDSPSLSAGLARTVTGYNYLKGSFSYFRGIARAQIYHDRLQGRLGPDESARAYVENAVLMELAVTVPPLTALIRRHGGDVVAALTACMRNDTCRTAVTAAALVAGERLSGDEGQTFAGRAATAFVVSMLVSRSGGGRSGAAFGLTAIYGDVRSRLSRPGASDYSGVLRAILLGE